MRRPALLPKLSLLFYGLCAAGGAWAGSDMFGALPGEFKASTIRPHAGQTVALTLQVTSDSALHGLKVAFAAPDGCAVLEASSAHHADVSLEAGRPTTFATRARVAREQPCKVVASVLQADAADARTGWVYAVVLNEKTPSNSGFSSGHDAAGHPTVDAVAR